MSFLLSLLEGTRHLIPFQGAQESISAHTHQCAHLCMPSVHTHTNVNACACHQCTHTPMCTLVHVHAKCRSKCWVSSSSMFHFNFGDRSLAELSAHQLDSLGTHQVLRISLPYLPGLGITGLCPCLVLMGSGTCQVLHPPESLNSHPH
jgi:hypothetical protein